MPQKAALMEVFGPYKTRIETKLEEIKEDFGEKTSLREACEYALKNGGKRFRPALVLMIAKGLGFGADVSYAALGVEFFHTASLIADDLPCMDNDDLRRDMPSLHKAFGESVALLASYVLIASGYGYLAKNGDSLRKNHHSFGDEWERLTLVLENATYTTGIFGASGGQFIDLFPPDLTYKTLREAIYKKTVSLFELSFVLGWVFGGGSMKKIDLVKKAAEHFGFAFQIADDLGDVAQDAENNRKVNMATVCGIPEAKQMFYDEISQFKKTLKELDFNSKELESIADLMAAKAGL